MIHDPRGDGHTHINVYSKGATELGRLLTNFAHTPFTLPGDGFFASVEAYWYWLQSPEPDRERLRPLYGAKAKEEGRLLRSAPPETTHSLDFRRQVARAIREKIRQNPTLQRLLHDSTLPLTHYYVYGKPDAPAPQKVVVPPDNEWIIETIEYYRKKLQTSTRGRSS